MKFSVGETQYDVAYFEQFVQDFNKNLYSPNLFISENIERISIIFELMKKFSKLRNDDMEYRLLFLESLDLLQILSLLLKFPNLELTEKQVNLIASDNIVKIANYWLK